jgi:hypothetical protein
MISLKPISSITQRDLEEINPGYSSSSVFQVHGGAGENEASFSLMVKNLERPFAK